MPAPGERFDTKRAPAPRDRWKLHIIVEAERGRAAWQAFAPSTPPLSATFGNSRSLRITALK
jgi:hypothetical protein